MLPRSVHAETLDHLAESDPRALRSRADLRRINRIMGARGILLREIRRSGFSAPNRVIEFGAGDGSLMLALAQHLAKSWPGVEITLLDRQRLVDARTLEAFRALGWRPRLLTMDMNDWIAGEGPQEAYDLALANLFLHHFDAAHLPEVLAGIARRCDALLACEPRRDRFALAASHLVAFVGANDVTREDAVLSVHAGFRGDELSACWPRADGGEAQWTLREGAAGLFSHCFSARRKHRKDHERAA